MLLYRIFFSQNVNVHTACLILFLAKLFSELLPPLEGLKASSSGLFPRKSFSTQHSWCGAYFFYLFIVRGFRVQKYLRFHFLRYIHIFVLFTFVSSSRARVLRLRLLLMQYKKLRHSTFLCFFYL